MLGLQSPQSEELGEEDDLVFLQGRIGRTGHA